MKLIPKHQNGQQITLNGRTYNTANKADAQAVQAYLASKGYNTNSKRADGTFDGIWGSGAQEAWKQYQQSQSKSQQALLPSVRNAANGSTPQQRAQQASQTYIQQHLPQQKSKQPVKSTQQSPKSSTKTQQSTNFLQAAGVVHPAAQEQYRYRQEVANAKTNNDHYQQTWSQNRMKAAQQQTRAPFTTAGEDVYKVANSKQVVNATDPHKNQKQVIFDWKKKNGVTDPYIITDKENGRMERYVGDSLTHSWRVMTGANTGDIGVLPMGVDGGKDAQGKTIKIPTIDPITKREGPLYYNWLDQSKSTGAGAYTVRDVSPTSTYGGPIFRYRTEMGDPTAQATHVVPKGRNMANKRGSTGCMNVDASTANQLYDEQLLNVGDTNYVLPSRPTNYFYAGADGRPTLQINDSSYKHKDYYQENPTPASKAAVLKHKAQRKVAAAQYQFENRNSEKPFNIIQ